MIIDNNRSSVMTHSFYGYDTSSADYMHESVCLSEVDYINNLVIAEESYDEYDEYAVTYEGAVGNFFKNIWEKIKHAFQKIIDFFKNLFGGKKKGSSDSGDSSSSSSEDTSKPIATRANLAKKNAAFFLEKIKNSDKKTVKISGFSQLSYPKNVMGASSIPKYCMDEANKTMNIMYERVNYLGSKHEYETGMRAKGFETKTQYGIERQKSGTGEGMAAAEKIENAYRDYKINVIRYVTQRDMSHVLSDEPESITGTLIRDVCRGKYTEDLVYGKDTLLLCLKMISGGETYKIVDSTARKIHNECIKSRDRLEKRVKDFENVANSVKDQHHGSLYPQITKATGIISKTVINMCTEVTGLVSGLDTLYSQFTKQTFMAARAFLGGNE